jgi:hypothetical protein
MPNWCWQYVTVKGSKEDLRSLLDAMRLKDAEGNDVYGLNHLYPCPKELAETHAMHWSGDQTEQAEIERKQAENLAKFGYKDWYEWANSNWGTKWGACGVVVDDDSRIDSNGELTFQYESAWAPATGLLAKVSAQFPNLIIGFYCREEADFFATMHVFYGGEMTHEDEVGLDGEPQAPEGDASEEEWDKFYEKQNEWNANVNSTLMSLMEDAMHKVEQGVTA